jgi:hypothetical protein
MRRNQSALSLLFMVLAFGIAYILDWWTLFAQRDFAASFAPGPYIVAFVVSALLLAAVWVLLDWWILPTENSWRVYFIYILSGLVVLLYPPLRLKTGWLRLGFFYDPDSRLAYTGAFIAVLGVISWLLTRRVRAEDEIKPS